MATDVMNRAGNALGVVAKESTTFLVFLMRSGSQVFPAEMYFLKMWVLDQVL